MSTQPNETNSKRVYETPEVVSYGLMADLTHENDLNAYSDVPIGELGHVGYSFP